MHFKIQESRPQRPIFLLMMRQQFPTIERIAIPPTGDVSFYIVMAMKQRYAGEARSALLAAIASNLRPKRVIVVDPDIDVHDSDQVAWALAFRMQPTQDVIIVERVPGGPLDPSIDPSIAPHARLFGNRYRRNVSIRRRGQDRGCAKQQGGGGRHWPARP